MKDFVVYLIGALLGLVLLGFIIYGLRMFTTASTPITVHEVRPGVLCALATTSDGAAISCWKDKP